MVNSIAIRPVPIDVHRLTPYEYEQTSEPMTGTYLVGVTITVGTVYILSGTRVPTTRPAWADSLRRIRS